MITKDQFNQDLYKVLVDVKSGTMPIGKAQRRIRRLAQRLYHPNDEDGPEPQDWDEPEPATIYAGHHNVTSRINIPNALSGIAQKRHRERLAARQQQEAT